MIRAVFFDWFNTLARYEPTREDMAARVLTELGFKVSPNDALFAIAVADRGWFEENTRSPVRSRSREEQAKVYARYQQEVLKQLGIDTTDKPELLSKVVARMQTLSSISQWALFEDVQPTMVKLKERGLTIGVLTNMDQDMLPLSKKLGLEQYVDLFVTSGEIGADKPKPQIFLAAMERSGVQPSQAVHVGDQYAVDVVGARAVGIKPLLIDRNDFSPEVTDCPRLRSLTEIVNHLG